MQAKLTKLETEKLITDMKRVVRNVNELKTQMELVYKEREILEDILNGITQLREAILINQKHQDNTKQEFTQGLKKVELAVEDTGDKVNKFSTNAEIVIVKKDSIFKKVRTVLKRKKNEKKKDS